MKLVAKLVIILCFTLMTLQINAQDIKGSWEGVLKVQEGVELPIIFHIKEVDKVYSSTMDSPLQDAFNVPMDETTYQEGDLTIALTQAGIKYVAKLEDGKIRGTFYQGGLELPLVLELKKQE